VPSNGFSNLDSMSATPEQGIFRAAEMIEKDTYSLYILFILRYSVLK